MIGVYRDGTLHLLGLAFPDVQKRVISRVLACNVKLAWWGRCDLVMDLFINSSFPCHHL